MVEIQKLVVRDSENIDQQGKGEVFSLQALS